MSESHGLGVKREAVLRLLADGEFHSGEVLGQLLGVSRAAVWKQFRQLEGLGLYIESSKGRGYRLPGGLDLIDEEKLRRGLPNKIRAQLSDIRVLGATDSTNKQLMAAIAEGEEPHGRVLLAEYQADGRGRRGRHWFSPLGASVCASLAWRSESGIAGLEGLSLAVGVVVAEALAGLGVAGLALKWPNDIVVGCSAAQGFAKLGGVLVEIKGDVAGECWIVVGVGLNVRMPPYSEEVIGQPVTDIARSVPHGIVLPSRTEVAQRLICGLTELMSTFQVEGFAGYRTRWQALHAYHGLAVQVSGAGAIAVAGCVEGVDASGALIVNDGTVRHVLSGGELSLRAVQ